MEDGDRVGLFPFNMILIDGGPCIKGSLTHSGRHRSQLVLVACERTGLSSALFLQSVDAESRHHLTITTFLTSMTRLNKGSDIFVEPSYESKGKVGACESQQ